MKDKTVVREIGKDLFVIERKVGIVKLATIVSGNIEDARKKEEEIRKEEVRHVNI
jgi:hypothetical protein